MLEKAITLFERLVIALELIASQGKPTVADLRANDTAPAVTKRSAAKTQREDAEDEEELEDDETKAKTPAKSTRTRKAPVKSKPATDDDADDEDDAAVKPKPGRRSKANDPDPKEPKDGEEDFAELRADISSYAKPLAGSDDDDIQDEFDDLLEDFGVKTVSKVTDKDVVKFHAAIKKLAEKYFDFD